MLVIGFFINDRYGWLVNLLFMFNCCCFVFFYFGGRKSLSFMFLVFFLDKERFVGWGFKIVVIIGIDGIDVVIFNVDTIYELR